MVYVEFVVAIMLFLTWVGWSIWYNVSTKKARRQYDKQRTGRNPNFEAAVGSSSRPAQFEGRKLFQTTDALFDGQVSGIPGKNSNSHRKVGFLRRRRRK